MAIVRQSSFAGGELDPLLHGRTDHPKYGSGARQLVNMIVSPHGAAKNRPGTLWRVAVKDGAVSSRLVPFLWPLQNYVLEFGNLVMRVYSGGVFVVEVATPFTTPMLSYLKYAQKDAVLTVCYGGQEPGGTAAIAPQEIRRVAHANWTVVAIAVVPPVSPTIATILHMGQPVKTSFVPDATHPEVPWQWQGTQLVRIDATGEVFETVGTDATPYFTYSVATTYVAGTVAVYGGNIYTALHAGVLGQPDVTPADWALGVVVYPDRPMLLAWASGAPAAGYSIVAVNLYRGKSGVFGIVGADLPVNGNFTDLGADPDYTQQPPVGTNPFATPAGDYPAVVSYFQQRRVFGRQPTHLGRIRASKTGQPSNFDTTLISQNEDALNFDLASNAIEEIRSLVSLRALIALTSTGASTIRGSASSAHGVALAPSSIDVTRQSARGASWVDPVIVDDTIIYAQAKGSSVRAVAYNASWETLDGPGNDLSTVAGHLLRGHSVVDMAYAETPDSIIWIVREDGVLLGITWAASAQPEQQVYAWHQHSTAGAFERVCVVPEGGEDVAYLVVRRTIGGVTARYIERLASRTDDVRMGVFLDAALTFDGRNVGATTMQFAPDAGTYLGGEEGTVTASAAVFVGASDVGDVVMLDPNGTAGGPFRLTIIDFTDTTHVRVQLDRPLPAAFQGAPTASWAFARDTMTGLAHLEGQSVTVLADGAVQGPYVVTGGAIALNPPGAYVTAGLSYNADTELLDVAANAVRPNVKAVSKVHVEVVASRGLLVGPDASKLRPWMQRLAAPDTGVVPLETGTAKVSIESSWNVNGRAFIRQADPLPLTIIGVSREVEVGGR